MRPRFSLRLFLIAFTLLAILFGAAAHFVYRVKEQIHRQKATVKKLNDMDCRFDWVTAAHAKSRDGDPIVILARKWIDKRAYSPSRPIRTKGKVSASRAAEILTVATELFDLDGISLDVDELTVELIDQLERDFPEANLALKFDRIATAARLRLPKLRTTGIHVGEPLDNDFALLIGTMHQLQSLQIDVSKLSATGDSNLRALPQLTLIEFHGRIDRPEPLLHLFHGSKLERLIFRNCEVSDKALSALEFPNSVEFIHFENCSLPQSLSARLAKAPQLKRLEMESEIPLTAAQLVAIPQCGRLESITVVWPKLGNEDFAAWRPPPLLKSFGFPGEVDEEVIREFLRTVPQCEIEMHERKIRGPSHQSYKSFKSIDGQLKVEEWSRFF